MRFNHKYYVPTLKAKAGELTALTHAAGKVTGFTPMIEIARADQALAAAATAINNAWVPDQPIFIDTLHVELETSIGDLAIELFSNEATAIGLKIIPVTGLSRTDDQKDATARTAAAHGAGACIRLNVEDIEEPADIDAPCQELLTRLGLANDAVDAVIDLDSIVGLSTPLLTRLVSDAINVSTFLQSAATLTILGSAFPENLTGITSGVITPIARSEWTLWEALMLRNLARKPSYGDYAAAHPGLMEFDPEKMTPAAKIIYAHDFSWLALKGKSVRGPAKFTQFHALSGQMISQPQYRHPGFSWGDNYLNDCASKAVGPGNLQTWVTVKTSHHLAQVVGQLASHP